MNTKAPIINDLIQDDRPMKYYDFIKARKLIDKYKDSITDASLGMYEDWFWTGTTIWEKGAYTHEIVNKSVNEIKVLVQMADEKRDKLLSDAGYTLMSYTAKTAGLLTKSLMKVVGKELKDVEEVDEEFKKLQDEVNAIPSYAVGGTICSVWATPCIELRFKDDSVRMISCYVQEGIPLKFEDDVTRKIEKQELWASGVLSAELQDNIPPLEDEEVD